MELNSREPIFIQIYNYYKRLINLGIFYDGEEMPSVREVAISNRVNPNTVQRAFSLLVEEGYLNVIPKKGYFVIYKEQKRKVKQLGIIIKKLCLDGYTKEELLAAIKEVGEEKND